MTADLVTRLRGWLDEDVPIGVIMNEAADRIERLEAELLGEVTEHSRRRMQVDNQADRIAQLEAALREIAEENIGNTAALSVYLARAALGEDRT